MVERFYYVRIEGGPDDLNQVMGPMTFRDADIKRDYLERVYFAEWMVYTSPQIKDGEKLLDMFWDDTCDNRPSVMIVDERTGNDLLDNKNAKRRYL